MRPLQTPPSLLGKPVIFKKNGVVIREDTYEVNRIHCCACGCVYDIIDVIDDPGNEPIRKHRHIRTGEWTQCQLTIEPMKMPAGLLDFGDGDDDCERKP